jgi:hypothetical protein
MSQTKAAGYSIEVLDDIQAQHIIKLTMHGEGAAVLRLSSEEGRALAVDLMQLVHRMEVQRSLLGKPR